MANRYVLELSAGAFKQNFRNLLEDLEVLSASIVSSLAQAVLLAGRAGGQQVAGGTAASEDLTLTSNATATKDRVFLGSAQTSAYDELNDRLGIGTNAPAMDLHVEKTLNGDVGIRAVNQSTGTSGNARVTAATVSNNARVTLFSIGSGYTAFSFFGLTPASWTFLGTQNGNGLGVGTLISAPLVLGTNNVERMRIDSGGDVNVVTGNLSISTAGKGLKVKEGTNARMGVATLVAGTVTVNTTAVSATSRIFLTGQNTAGVALHGELTVSARVAGTSFTILSVNGGDVRQVAWLIVDPA